MQARWARQPMGAIIASPSRVAEAAAIRAHALLRGTTSMWTTHLVAAVLAVVARDAETEAMNTHAVSSAVLHPWQPLTSEHSTPPYPGSQSSGRTHTSLVHCNPPGIVAAQSSRSLTNTYRTRTPMHTNPIVMALECALLLQRAFRATEASSQAQVPLIQMPWPEHAREHSFGSSQADPSHPTSQKQIPSRHAPWPVQLDTHSKSATEQSLPPYPGSQWQPPRKHTPRLEQSFSQTDRLWQYAPAYPGRTNKCPGRTGPAEHHRHRGNPWRKPIARHTRRRGIQAHTGT